MADKLKYYVHCEFQDQLNNLLTEVKDLAKSSGYNPPGGHGKSALTPEFMAILAAAMAGAASKCGVWCKNVNQNGAANKSNILP
ncbi:MAG: hypothetical protein ACOY46_00390 [Bacillota bacterium]